MKIGLKATFVVALVIAAHAFTSKASAQINLEVEPVSNPWLVDNQKYCVSMSEKCIGKTDPQDNDSISPRKSRYAADNSNMGVIATAQSISYDSDTIRQISPDQTLSSTKLFSLINQYRTRNGLAPFVEDERICSVAANRTPELYNEIFGTSYMHKGFHDRNLPYWATENMIYEMTEEAALSWWQHSAIHNSALLGNYTYSCVRCQGKTCSEVFTNFEPKLLASY